MKDDLEWMGKMSGQPICFGKWLTQSANKCELCSIQLECYSKMRESEKKQEKLELPRQTQLCRRNSGDVESAHGVCERCG